MTDLDLEAIKARREGVPHASQWGLYKTVVPYNAEYDLEEHPVVELDMLTSTSEEADRTFDFLAEITWDIDALVEEVERLRERTTTAGGSAHEEALKRFPEPVDVETGEPVDDWGHAECSRESFIDGATWALSTAWAITDDMVERAAKAVKENIDHDPMPEWHNPDQTYWDEERGGIHTGVEGVVECTAIARAALEAALQEEVLALP